MRTITTILYQDSPTGIKTIEFSNRLIKGIFIPRISIKDFLNLNIQEIHHSWVYFLIWLNEQRKEKIYVGQTVNLKTRLEQHNKWKEFWHSFLFFTNKENSLIESDLNYLEKELIQKIVDLGNVDIENKTIGNPCLIQNNRKADMHDFLEDLRILIWNLWFNFLEKNSNLFLNVENYSWNDKELLYYNKRGSNAIGKLLKEKGWFIVFKNSICSLDCTISWVETWIETLREKLVKEKVLQMKNWVLIFQRDYIFKSPSWAAWILAWSNRNGWVEWFDNEWKNLNQIIREN